MAFLVVAQSVGYAAELLPKCGVDVKPEKFASLSEYSPHPCESISFSVEVEFTVGTNGRAGDIGLLRPKILPPDKRACIADVVGKWLGSAARFSRPQGPCRYRLRVTAQ